MSFIPGLSDDVLTAYRDGALRVTSPMSQSVIFHLAGALINDHAADDGAMGIRDAAYVTAFAGCWPPPDPGRRSTWRGCATRGRR